MNLLRHALLIVSALALVFPGLDTVSAQQIERPTDCEEVMTVGPVFIGHNCGEFASIMINGRIIIRRPWSRVNRASRAERLRLRAGGVATVTTTAATSPPGRHPRESQLRRFCRTGRRSGVLRQPGLVGKRTTPSASTTAAKVTASRVNRCRPGTGSSAPTSSGTTA